MIIKSSDQVSRFTWLKRFPIPRNFKVTAESRIEKGAHGLLPLAQRGRRRSMFIVTIPIPAVIRVSTGSMSTSTIADRWFSMR